MRTCWKISLPVMTPRRLRSWKACSAAFCFAELLLLCHRAKVCR